MIKRAVINQKGGVGKTTTTVNTAGALSEDKKVLILDFDPQGNSTSHLGFDKEEIKYTIMDLINKVAFKENPDLKFDDVVLEYNENLHVIPADILLAGAEISLVKVMGREKVLEKVFKKHKEEFNRYDIVLIDCPPSLGLLTINVLVTSDTCLIPVQAEAGAIEGLGQLLDTIEMIKEEFNEELSIEKVLITTVDLRHKAFPEAKEYLEESFPNELAKNFIRRNTKLTDAWTNGKTIFDFDNKSNGAKDYKNFSKELK